MVDHALALGVWQRARDEGAERVIVEALHTG
jgi:hypothetical protein